MGLIGYQFFKLRTRLFLSAFPRPCCVLLSLTFHVVKQTVSVKSGTETKESFGFLLQPRTCVCLLVPHLTVRLVFFFPPALFFFQRLSST